MKELYKKTKGMFDKQHRYVKYALVFVTICVVLVLINMLFNRNTVAKINSEGTPVEVTEVSIGDISNEVVYGTKISAAQSISIVPKAYGKITKVYVELGDSVKKNQVLFKVDPKDVENQVSALSAQYNAAVAAANVAYFSYQSAIGSKTETTLQQASSNLEMLTLQYNDLKTTMDNITVLYEQGAVSKAEYDSTKLRFDQARINLDNAKKSYDLTQNTTTRETREMAYSQYQQAIASRNSTKVQLDNARDMLQDTSVKSPIDGIVSMLNITENQTLGAGVIPCTVVNMDSVLIELSVSESVVSKINKEDMVKVTVASLPDKMFEGTILAFSPAANIQTSTYPVKISIDNKEKTLMPGMFAKLIFNLNSRQDSLIIPREAVVTLGDENYVFIVENGVALKRNVVLGIDTGREIEIVEGVKQGDRLIIKGQTYLSENDKVKIVTGE